jgi:hypothetical protein
MISLGIDYEEKFSGLAVVDIRNNTIQSKSTLKQRPAAYPLKGGNQ